MGTRSMDSLMTAHLRPDFHDVYPCDSVRLGLASRLASDTLADEAHHSQQSRLGGLDIAAVNVELQRGPVAHAAIVFCRYGDDAQVRIRSQDGVTNTWALAQFIQRNHQNVWRGALHRRGNFGFAGDLADNLDTGAVSQRRQQQLTHQPRTVVDKDADGPVHMPTPEILWQVFAEYENGGGSKTNRREDQRSTKG